MAVTGKTGKNFNHVKTLTHWYFLKNVNTKRKR